jgi:Flp pilus assembly pilin Flp
MKATLPVLWDEAGASAVEYALLLVGIALAVVGSVAIFGTLVKDFFDRAVAIFPA